jgi:putative addiction module killer protein
LWFARLSPAAAVKVEAAIARMRAGNFGDHKSVGEGVWERRIDWGPGLRIYYGRKDEKLVLLLGGGDKSSQSRDILRAREFWQWKR